ncbi:SDR family NAD(P)-dependent oxidoreductase [Luteipulveratus sp. YIM 133132]|uniref:SDR family NAD(P)-dependent oxidoreductase n=1 Tax=Luteipulveratus flavus TaxID=3031728 RepID=UPI0023B0FFEA|nr:SDR family NAD(P)-dependent oxidoreductase [Luteipulveratus sp. YIM 133132]MDE9365659.1 SDR family NAD(P)-dependent oxidoreductase [Luteipulveratus sp. YIM 133132]
MDAARTVSQALDTLMDRAVVPGYSTIGIRVRRRLPTWPDDPPADALTGQNVLVTGASSGLGAQCVADLAALGAHVHLVVRDVQKGQRVADRIPAPAGTTVWRCDLSDLDSVAELAESLLALGQPLTGIVHNAGVMPPERAESPQHHEVSLAVHVLGPVALTERLRPLLRGQDARVVLVTSGGMYAQPLPLDDLEYERELYRPATAYARSKRVQVALLPTLQERWGADGVRVYGMHPGWADTPGVTESLPRFATVMGPVLRPTGQGADTTGWLLATPHPPPGGGLWHDRRERPTDYSSRTRTSAEERRRLWEWVSNAARVNAVEEAS